MYVKAGTTVPAQAFPGESAWKLRITYSNKGSESHISTGKRACRQLFRYSRMVGNSKVTCPKSVVSGLAVTRAEREAPTREPFN